MDYEQRYKEALERAREFQKSKDGLCVFTAESIFPELKESEEEKIRKWLLDTITQIPNDSIEWDVIEKAKVLSWLEKQGESYTKKDVDDAYLKGVTNTKNEIEKQYEANYQIRKDIATFIFNYRGDIKDRAKWMDYLGIKVSFVEKQDEKKVTTIDFNAKDWYVSKVDGKIHNINISSEKQGEQKPVNDTVETIVEAVSNTSILDMIEDKDAFTNPGVFENSLGHLLKLFEKLPKQDLLDGLKFYTNVVEHDGKYVKPTWSEEDETGWTNTMIMIKEVASNHYTKDSIKLVIDWLKSLKKRLS